MRFFQRLRCDCPGTAGEAGVAGAVVELYYSYDGIRGNSDDSRVGEVITDDAGGYLFERLASGNYYVVSHAPVGFVFTTPNVGTDDSADSDVSSTGISDLFTLQPGQRDTSRDTGVGGSLPGFGLALRVGCVGGRPRKQRCHGPPRQCLCNGAVPGNRRFRSRSHNVQFGQPKSGCVCRQVHSCRCIGMGTARRRAGT